MTTTRTDDQLLVGGLAAMRVGAGVALLVAPARAAALVFGPGSVSSGGARILVRALGIRDIVLGIGTWNALAEGRARPWLRFGALADASDALAVVADFGALPRWRRWLLLMAAAGSATVSGQLGDRVD